MHEASLMKNLMRRLDEIASTEQAKRITGVSVWLGALSHMSAAHFAEHFEESSAGTIAEGAKLDVTVSDDPKDPNAQEILVRSVTVDT
ncbi:MAG: hydrogenase maturation nickel metallochaperone HypA [Alphaproteobacteria bacterium]|nr:hydrogenase maturation nickel metallochaperone HypA [Alphaproteobacteria bacterium]MDE1987377.1 hydrogenase maturation nickel metallochaperone HypA [Alphaproteobacteria bacterium]MDE2162747.1 hydrogenase maturation nickel metallochaperone HypA [Alphaproteobacteria bacterium]MDE2498699.1 hydrogenase maturation nickel metallochaperone HypA [Alphaproteobacteria bacterium]